MTNPFVFCSVYIPILVYSHKPELKESKEYSYEYRRKKRVLRVTGLTLCDRVRSPAIQESFGVELQLQTEESDEVIKIPYNDASSQLLLELYQACPAGWRHLTRPWTCWRHYVSPLLTAMDTVGCFDFSILQVNQLLVVTVKVTARLTSNTLSVRTIVFKGTGQRLALCSMHKTTLAFSPHVQMGFPCILYLLPMPVWSL